jgi:hypothetical protein
LLGREASKVSAAYECVAISSPFAVLYGGVIAEPHAMSQGPVADRDILTHRPPGFVERDLVAGFEHLAAEGYPFGLCESLAAGPFLPMSEELLSDSLAV